MWPPLWLTLASAFTLLAACAQAQPAVLKATYDVQETYLLGNTYRHAIFDIEFDGPISYPESWAVPCIPNSTFCTAANKTLTPVPEANAFTWIDLPHRSWVPVRVNFTDKVYLRFTISRNGSSCPSMVIRVNMYQGEPNFYISNKFVPTQVKKIWFFPSWSTTDAWHMHPSHEEYGYGTYYILQTAQPPLSSEVYYEIMFDTFETPACPPMQALISPASDDLPWTQLHNGRAWEGPMVLNEYQYFRLFVETTCTDFAASGRQAKWTQFGDLDLFASYGPDNKYPDGDNGYIWASQIDGDGAVVARGLCNPEPGVTPWPIYVTALNWAQDKDDVVIGVVTASTLSDVIITRPILELNAYSFKNVLASGGAVLVCGDNDEERYVCEYPSYDECHLGGNNPNLFGCCSPFYPVPPTRDPIHSNQIFPENLDVGFYLGIVRRLPWTEYMDRSELIPNSLRWAVIMDVHSGRDLLHNIAAPHPETCRIEFHSVWSDESGSPLNDTVSFEPRVLTCNYTEVTSLTQQALTLISEMQKVTAYDALQFLHVKLQFLTLSDAWRGCKSHLEKFVIFENVTAEFLDQTTCPQGNFGFQTDTYLSDACCAKANELQSCCLPKTLSMPEVAAVESNADALTAQCQVTECSRRTTDSYIQALQIAEDVDSGCIPVWKKEASEAELARLTEFAPRCRVKLLGFYDMPGSPCESDADCFYGAACDLTRGLCQHTEDHVIQCWAENMDAEVAFALFDYWRNDTLWNVDSLQTLIREKMMTSSFCTGPKSLRFRNHILFHQELDGCEDACLSPSLGIDLEPRCFETNPEFCPIPPECDQSTTIVGLCYRSFFPRRPDATLIAECETEQACNWNPCNTPSLNTTASCRAACLAVPNVCLRCIGAVCTHEENITTSGACNAGYCSTSKAITNPTSCANSGTCTVSCEGAPCLNASACVAAGECRGFESLEENNITEGCFEPFVTDEWGDAYCGPDLEESPYPFGCLNNITSRTACQAANFLWVAVPNSEAECLSQIAEVSGCFNGDLWTSMNQSQCQTCGNTWEPPLRWENGVWTPGIMIRLLWTPSRYGPIRTFRPSLDYELFRHTLEAAIVASKSLSFSTEALCKYSAEMSSMTTIACDCGSEGESEGCFKEGSSRQIALARACPYVNSTITNNYVTIDIPADAFNPAEFCKTLGLSLRPASRYELDLGNKLSSEIFLARIPSSFSVVKNLNQATVGQIVTNGIRVNWTLGTEPKPMRICIPILAATKPQYSIYPETSLGYIPIGSRGVRILSSAVRVGDKMCGEFSKPGTYFGVINYADYETLEEYDPATRIMAIVSAVLYFGLMVGVAIQIYRVVSNKPLTWELKIGFAVIVFIFAAFRGVYMAIPPSVYGGDSVTILFVFEFPSFIFFIMFTTVLYLWTQVLYKVRTMKRKQGQIKIVWRLYLIVNTVMFLLFVVFVIVYYTIQEKAPLPCQEGDIKAASGNKFTTNLAYLIFNAIVVLLLAIVYIALGVSLVKQVGRTSKMTIIIQMTLLVTCTFVPMFLVKSALILWSAIANGVVPLIVFSLLEVIPAGVLLYFILPQMSSKSEVVSVTGTTQGAGLKSLKAGAASSDGGSSISSGD